MLCLQEYLEFRKERSKMLLSRRNQLLLEFSFWNEPQPRAGPHIYELRTYKLKVPGSQPSPLAFCLPRCSVALQDRLGVSDAPPSWYAQSRGMCIFCASLHTRCESGPMSEPLALGKAGFPSLPLRCWESKVVLTSSSLWISSSQEP